jgi:ABC-2 type transport system ATP-binding protein
VRAAAVRAMSAAVKAVKTHVRLESVGKRYGLREPWIIRDVTLDVRQGQLIRLEGRNGTGKSTLLKVAAGVLLPSSGTVTGRPHTGYVPERFPGGFAFPARDYLMHMARVHGLRGASVRTEVGDWLDRFGAASFADSPLRSLSKGMCQKVALTQALVPRPGLLVLDEAWTGLDQGARAALDAAVAERVADGGTVMFVDHDQARLAGRINERWQLSGGGAVRVVPGSGSLPRAGDDPVVVIEVSGLEAESLSRLTGLTGVLSASVSMVRVASTESDNVLRELLSLDGVHVRALRAETVTDT